MNEILQLEKPDDFVCATGKSHSVRDLCKYTFQKLGMKYQDYVIQNPKYMRPNELHDLKGDTSKLKKVMNFNLEYTFETMIDEMIDQAMKEY
jgi:GDPmannose 4,6-dehydratase